MVFHLEKDLDDLLTAYAAGRLPAPLAVLVAAHLELKPDNQRFIEGLEVLSGQALEAVAPLPLSHREERLSKIFAISPREETAPKAHQTHRLPRVIRYFIGYDADAVPWKTILPGVREYQAGEYDGLKVSLLSIRPQQKIPAHTHEGWEATLVCEGGFSDSTGSYERGDISLTDSSINHRPVAHPDGECLCFAVQNAPLRLTGKLGRFFNRFIQR